MKQRTESRYVLRQVQKDRYEGTVADARKVEDAIIAWEGFTVIGGYADERHPVQGEDASRAFSKTYEVYPDKEDKPVGRNATLTMKWVIVRFFFDYRSDHATIKVRTEGVRRLRKVIPGFAEALGHGIGEGSIGEPTAGELEPAPAVPRQ